MNAEHIPYIKYIVGLSNSFRITTDHFTWFVSIDTIKVKIDELMYTLVKDREIDLERVRNHLNTSEFIRLMTEFRYISKLVSTMSEQ